MKMDYGISTGNRFTMLLAGDNPENVVPQQKQPKEKKAKKVAQPKLKEVDSNVVPKQEQRSEPRQRDTDYSRERGGRRGGSARPAFIVRERDAHVDRVGSTGPVGGGSPAQQDDAFGDRRGRGGGGGFRGMRGGRGAPFRKREFDRHSGSVTGRKPVEKRDGGGSHNWGNPVKEGFDAAEEKPAHEHVETEESPQKASWADQVEDAEEAGELAEADPEASMMTLDEYRKKIAEDGKDKSAFKIRKAGDGEDKKKWKHTSVLEKEDYDEDGVIYERSMKSSGRLRHMVDIDIKFSDRGRGGRGTRGTRGGRGRGEGRGAPGGGSGGRGRAYYLENRDAAFNEDDFPNLG